MQKFVQVPFKMPEIFSHALGGGLEIWASICFVMDAKTIIPFQPLISLACVYVYLQSFTVIS